MSWKSISLAPHDGSRQYVKRVHNGRVVKEGWARWCRANEAAEIRFESYGGLDGPIPADAAYADTPRWRTDDGLYSFPEPTHWLPDRQ